MNVKNFSLVLAIMAMSVSSVSAQNFFWSTANFGNSAAEVNNIDTSVDPTGTVYLYYGAGQSDIVEGIDLNFSWDVNGVVGFTAAETFEADILFGAGGPDFGDRWGDGFGAASDVTSDAVTGFLTLNVLNGDGILNDNIPGNTNGAGLDFVDTLYDETNSAFLVGSFDYETLSDGTASIQVDGLVVNGTDIGASYTPLTFSGTAIPEPASAGLLACGLIGLVSRRRR